MILQEQILTRDQFKLRYSGINGKLSKSIQNDRFTFEYEHLEEQIDLVLETIISVDPTSKDNLVGNYSQWVYKCLIKELQNSIIDLDEFKEKYKQVLIDYHSIINHTNNPELKNELKGFNKNINTIQDYDSLKKEIDNFKNILPKKYHNEFNELIDKNELVHAFDGKDWDIWIPLSEEQSKIVGQGSEWCISYKNNNHFHQTYDVAPIYIIIHKTNKTNEGVPIKYQLFDKVGYFEFNNMKNNNLFLQNDNDNIKSEDKGFITFLFVNPELKKQFQNMKKVLDKIQPLNSYYKDQIKNYNESKIYLASVFKKYKDGDSIDFTNLDEVQYYLKMNMISVHSLIKNNVPITEKIELQVLERYEGVEHYIELLEERQFQPSERQIIELMKIDSIEQLQRLEETVKDFDLYVTEEIMIEQVRSNWAQIYRVEDYNFIPGNDSQMTEKIKFQQVENSANKNVLKHIHS